MFHADDKELRRAAQVQTSPEWATVRAIIEKEKQGLAKDLLAASEAIKIGRLQGKIAAYDDLLDFFGGAIAAIKSRESKAGGIPG